ncbi:MAG: 1-acyl-sn-glycerol-3-phosphate acyltransferase [Flavobacteriales bacterium]
MKKWIATRLLDALGWTFIGQFDPELDKAVIIGAPHTSNWDFALMISAIWRFNFKLNFLIKSSWLRFPFNMFMKPLGAIGVDFSQKDKRKFTAQLVHFFEHSDRAHLLLSPEGSRSKVSRWKTGFYRIANHAKVPIVLCFADYEKKIYGFGPSIQPSGDFEKDMQLIQDFYADKKGKIPEKYDPQIF